MKKLIIWLVIICILAVVGYTVNSYATLFNGAAAKEVCSCMYLSDREQESIEMNDLNSFFIKLSTNVVDEENRTVTSSFFGIASKTAVYRDGLGCALVNDADINEVMKQSFKPNIPVYDADTIFWPSGDKMRDTILANIDTYKLNKAIEEALNEGHTRGIVVAYDTLFMAEGYNHGFDKDTRILGWSMTKSIMSTMTGILVKQGKLKLDGETSIHEWKNDERKNINLKNLLQMSSGLEWEEDYGKISEVTTMLFSKSDVAKYSISQKAIVKPDSLWVYSSGTSNIISEIIKRACPSQEDYLAFPQDELFSKIGMRSMVLETDAAGTFIGSSYSQATPRDWARYGLLYLQDGYWGNEQILPDGWVDFTKTPALNSKGEYGAQFWLNSAEEPELPDAPSDIYFADGYNGQRVYIVPSHNLVIVRLGLSRPGEFDYNKFVTSILAAVDNK